MTKTKVPSGESAAAGSKKFTLANYKISMQINMIGLVVFICMFLIAATYYVGTQKVESLNAKAAVANKKLDLAMNVQYQFLNARRDEKDFMLRGDKKYLDKHAQTSAVIHKDIAALEALITDPNVESQLISIEEHFSEYEAQFKDVAKNLELRGLTHTEGLEGDLRAAVHSAEEALKDVNQPNLSVIMLMMRRHEKDFMLRKDPKYIASMQERLAEFEDALRTSFVPLEQREAILELIKSYHASFNALAQIDLSNEAEIKELSAIFAKASPVLDQVTDDLRREYMEVSEQAAAVTEQTYIIVMSVIVLAVIAAVALALFIGRQISRPVEQLTDTLMQLSENNLDVTVPGKDRKDEIGKMARSVGVLRENSLEMRRLEAEQKKEQEIQLIRAQKLEQLTSDFEKSVSDMVHGLAAASTQLDATAQSMSNIASETTSQSDAMSAASQSTNENIQTVATASEELSVSIRELSQQVQTTSESSNAVAQDAQRASTQIQELVNASDKIGDIVQLIQEIAEQTNLLALNATIESARAGEAGKGFAVVANEVKSLANETARATEQISSEVQSVQAQIKASVAAIKNIETKIQDVNVSAAAIAAAIEEQTATTEEINRSTQNSSINMQTLNGNVMSVSEAAQSTGIAANDVLGASRELGEQTEALRQSVTEFITKVKSA